MYNCYFRPYLTTTIVCGWGAAHDLPATSFLLESHILFTMMALRRFGPSTVAVGQFRMAASVQAAAGRVVPLCVGFQRGSTPFTAAARVEVDAVALQSALDDVFGSDQAGTDTQALINGKKRLLQAELSKLTAADGELQALQDAFEAMNASAATHAHRVMLATFFLLCAQNAVLFQWVFVTFDWNLVEPMTYFLGYSANTWLAMVFFKSTGRDFSYDGIVGELKQRRLDKLMQCSSFSLERLHELQAQESALRASIGQL
jgi:hypothetical protein